MRKGPLTRFEEGEYLGERVEDIIRVNPLYFMKAVKEYLDITPEQARVFRERTGGEIPDRFIRRVPEGPVDVLYWSNRDLLPNLAFYPEDTPGWWEEMWKIPSIRKREEFYNSHSTYEYRKARSH